ncbi:hypothetical protein N1851_009132 [Merluccius polli]|uniref:CCHC-type domain-containing protein n=1 Tax=Merluccius polli TaxID=89951 RepID=A0AA47N1U6_MERPO|nr:hypothetical protein N1851_009132 [Merluccius polli]
MLCPILLQMLPEDMALEYSRQRGDQDEWKVPDVLKFLQKEVQSRERASQMMRSYNQRENQSAYKTGSKSYSTSDMKLKKPSMTSAATLHTANQKTQNCLFCDSAEHKSESCPDHHVSACKEKLKKLGRCFVCLGPKHIARFCRLKGMSCATCGGKHHVAICEKNNVFPSAVSANMDTVISSVIPQAEKGKPDIENTVLLQTAKAWVVGPTSRKMVRCLLDGGSQGSFVHENVVRALQLPVTRQGTLTLHTFGSSAPTTVKRNIVKLSLENIWDRQQRTEIEAVVTPKVCTALMKVPGEHIQKEMNKRGLQLADFVGDDEPELSVLIGSDYYWQIVSGRVERLTESLVALESTFGWAVQGPVAVSSMTETTCIHIQLSEDAQIDKQLHAFWELESLGITSMELCKWMTNSPELKEKWLESSLDCTAQPETHGSVLKVLGFVSESTQKDVQEDEVKSELRSKHQIVVQFVNQDRDLLKPVLCLEKYSKLKTVLRVTAWINRFITNTRSSTKMSGELTEFQLRN